LISFVLLLFVSRNASDHFRKLIFEKRDTQSRNFKRIFKAKRVSFFPLLFLLVSGLSSLTSLLQLLDEKQEKRALSKEIGLLLLSFSCVLFPLILSSPDLFFFFLSVGRWHRIYDPMGRKMYSLVRSC
jgi:hypothetical protein